MRRTERLPLDDEGVGFVETTTGDAPCSLEITRGTTAEKDGRPRYGYTLKLYYATPEALAAGWQQTAAEIDRQFCQRYAQMPATAASAS